ncbi:tRNA 2-selenouridine(34) synthase MnmH [Jannaschia ovalis]|uniref:tRNA 2-selenouridine(34) synthase MnmH n=1 Tax=Jannaschia ovalis TaxID=3038773 RepID=A0ABY8LCE1_9RHOB|nr:tRNA 2-selenouridine(34) synthase MnmH [Jannaschia sp. GRR-S6-38]WGH78063.1 tRNA 2-selenouridine(34) synthase MnmH [Jannaschia sp. GRR-S6-38]
MARTLTSPLLDALPFDDVIDVRSPSEFAEDHIPGALNLPVLDDAERAKVGTIYTRQDRFLARRIGAALVARNAARHLEEALADRGGGWRPLVYCWRGGQRSGAFATILGQVGWRAETIEGGYRAYRRLVKRALYDAPFANRLILIDGGTGTGKTQLLDHLGTLGAQVVDLEGLAAHRGSNFGALEVPQPSQKMFESRLLPELARLDPDRPVFMEAESNAIGDILIPPALWKAMGTAEVVRLEAPLPARARFLTTTYPDLTADPHLLASRIDALRPYQPRERIEDWHALAAEERFAALAEGLIAHHYDPRYGRTTREGRRVIGEVTLTDLSEGDRARAAAEVLAIAGG